ncbi:MAG: sensor histidine kinase [Candidatus Neomarinimicrobiota bacterium]|nr:MAG: sensor histidine kinase [Candidatus Neomarinimicrobiota bacterium]
MNDQSRLEREGPDWYRRLATFPERNPLPVIELDSRCRVTYMNPACENLLKRLQGDDQDVRKILPQNCDRLIRDSLAGKLDIYAEEVALENKVLLWSGHPIQDLGVVHFYATDITRLKRIEEDLLEAKLKAEQSEKVKSLFLANMSHEIRTPLNSIIGFSELIENLTKDYLDEEQQFFFRAIRQNGERLMRTVHEILDISQIESGTFQLKVEELDLVSKVREVADTYRKAAEEKGLTFTLTCSLDEAPLYADPYCIYQALSNLVDNAVKFTPEGEVAVRLEPDGEEYRLEITDTGVGMSSEYLQNLYSIFSQESVGYTKKFQGVGLGLAITKRYLDLNRVRFRVRSEQGKGTVFTVWFDPQAVQPASD